MYKALYLRSNIFNLEIHEHTNLTRIHQNPLDELKIY